MLCTSFAQIAMFFAFLSDVSGQMRGQGGELGPKSRKIITRVGQNSYKHSFTVAMKVMMTMMMIKAVKKGKYEIKPTQWQL